VNHLAFSDEQQLVSCGNKHETTEIKRWELSSLLATTERSASTPGWVSACMALAPGGRSYLKLEGSQQGAGTPVWHLHERGKGKGRLLEIAPKRESLRNHALSPDGRRIAATTMSEAIFFDVALGKTIRVITYGTPLPSASAALQFSYDPTSTKLAMVRIIPTKPGELARQLQLQLFKADSGTELVPNIKPVDQFSSTKGRSADPGRPISSWVLALSWAPDGKHVAVGVGQRWQQKDRYLTTGRVFVWDASNGKNVLTRSVDYIVLTVAFDPKGRLLAAGGTTGQGQATLWDVSSGRTVWSLQGHNRHILAAVFSPDGARLFTAAADRLVKAWDVETHREILSLVGHQRTATALTFTPDGKQLISATGLDLMELFPPAVPAEVKVWDGSPREISKAAGG
jgi:WD40 repeat protein